MPLLIFMRALDTFNSHILAYFLAYLDITIKTYFSTINFYDCRLETIKRNAFWMPFFLICERVQYTFNVCQSMWHIHFYDTEDGMDWKHSKKGLPLGKKTVDSVNWFWNEYDLKMHLPSYLCIKCHQITIKFYGINHCEHWTFWFLDDFRRQAIL